MEFELRTTHCSDRSAASAGSWVVPWYSLWRGGLLAFCVAFALSTQLLFHFDLYGNWPVSDILLRWLN